MISAHFESLEPRRLLAATSLRIDAGGGGVTEGSGKVWQGDRGYTGGQSSGAANNLYASQRAGDFSYSLPIKNGTYKVKLLFEETSASPGHRVFSVVAERNSFLVNFDMASLVGKNTPVSKSLPIKVSDGRLNLWFQGNVGSAVLSGIEVTPIVPLAQPAANGITWKQVANAPQSKFESMGDVVNDKLYVFGGYKSASIQQTFQVAVYDPAKDQWATRKDMPESLSHSGTASDGNFIYLAGGYVGDWKGIGTPVTRHVWKYDTVHDTWTSMLSLPADRSAGALVRVGRKLHFFGGVDQSKVDRGDHWVLDLRHPTKWVSAAPMPDPRNHLGYIETGGKIYAIGGQHDLDEQDGNDDQVDTYDVVAGTWSSVASLPRVTSHVHNATFVVGGNVMIVGGSTTDEKSLADVLKYIPATNTWKTVGHLPVPLSAAVADLIDGHIIVTGGTSSGSVPMSDTWINV